MMYSLQLSSREELFMVHFRFPCKSTLKHQPRIVHFIRGDIFNLYPLFSLCWRLQFPVVQTFQEDVSKPVHDRVVTKLVENEVLYALFWNQY